MVTNRVALAVLLTGCANPAQPKLEPPSPASAQLSVSENFAGFAVVKIGDSTLKAEGGNRSPCVRWNALDGPVVVHVAVHGDQYGYNNYVWPVVPPETFLWVSVQQLDDSSLWVVWTYVNKVCGDTLLSRPGTSVIAPLHSLE